MVGGLLRQYVGRRKGPELGHVGGANTPPRHTPRPIPPASRQRTAAASADVPGLVRQRPGHRQADVQARCRQVVRRGNAYNSLRHSVPPQAVARRRAWHVIRWRHPYHAVRRQIRRSGWRYGYADAGVGRDAYRLPLAPVGGGCRVPPPTGWRPGGPSDSRPPLTRRVRAGGGGAGRSGGAGVPAQPGSAPPWGWGIAMASSFYSQKGRARLYRSLLYRSL